ncbi:MAG: hypothetical protein ABSE82_09435 [Nitrososphaerales archaeon]|jgi:transposase
MEDIGSAEIKKTLQDILVYTRLTAAAGARIRANDVIDTFEKANVYKSLTGTRSQQEIAKMFSLPRETVRNWMRGFSSAGLVSSVDENSTPNQKSLFALAELGIDLDALRTKSKRKKPADIV